MPNQGGRYEIRGGKRVLVECTRPAPEPKPQAPAKAALKVESKPATKSAAKQTGEVKETDNG